MAVIWTDGPRYSGLVKFEAHPNVSYHKEKVVMNDAATTLKAGTVLGKVTATGKYKVCKQAASDGSQLAAGVYVGDMLGDFVDTVLALNTDKNVLALVRGPAILADKALVWDASFTTQAQKDAALAPLATAGVLVSPQI